jgi:hypothetical protein
VLEALQAWVDAIQSVTPKVPSADIPFADWLPKPEEVVTNVCHFA